MITQPAINNKTRMMRLGTIANQNGVVLVVSLVFLVALTAVAAALMQSSTIDMKMSGASEEKVVALQEVVSAVDEVIFNQVGPGKINAFSKPVVGNFPVNDQSVLLPATVTKATATVDVANNKYNLDIACPHLQLASSTAVFRCNMLTIAVQRNYGRKNLSNISANSGIAQQLLAK